MEAGDVVKTLRGRDSGRLMFVLGKEGGFVRLVDGKLHRSETPKKKNLRHVQWIAGPEGNVPDKLRTGEKVFNSELRKALAAMDASEGEAVKGGSAKCPKTT